VKTRKYLKKKFKTLIKMCQRHVNCSWGATVPTRR